jgi:hypothetical protein
VWAEPRPPAGSEIRVNVLLPLGPGTSNLVMRAKATVVRVEAMNDPEFAAGLRPFQRDTYSKGEKRNYWKSRLNIQDSGRPLDSSGAGGYWEGRIGYFWYGSAIGFSEGRP